MGMFVSMSMYGTDTKKKTIKIRYSSDELSKIKNETNPVVRYLFRTKICPHLYLLKFTVIAH